MRSFHLSFDYFRRPATERQQVNMRDLFRISITTTGNQGQQVRVKGKSALPAKSRRIQLTSAALGASHHLPGEGLDGGISTSFCGPMAESSIGSTHDCSGVARSYRSTLLGFLRTPSLLGQLLDGSGSSGDMSMP
jgi:hypothetical protein